MIKAIFVTKHNWEYVHNELQSLFTDGRDLGRLMQPNKYVIIRKNDVVVWAPEVFQRQYRYVADTWDGSVFNEVRLATPEEYLHNDICSVLSVVMSKEEYNLGSLPIAMIHEAADKVIEWMKK